jgi:hypothetical protein
MRYFLMLGVTYATCIGQSLSIGVTGGGRTTDDVTCCATPESKRYVVGPMVELGLPLGFAVEFDALYHRHGYQISSGNFFGSSNERERANSWEFPMLLKYKLPVFKVKPFVEVGAAPRRISGTISVSGSSLDTATGKYTLSSGSLRTAWSSTFGVVTGGGIQFGLGRLRLSPEVRYTHWTNTPIDVTFADGPSFRSTQEQLDVLIGIGWRFR